MDNLSILNKNSIELLGKVQNKGVTPDIELPFVFNSQEVGESSYDNSLEEDFINPLE